MFGSDDSYLDKRLIERNLRLGLMLAKEYRKMLDSLPDVVEKGQNLSGFEREGVVPGKADPKEPGE
ncbi:MAG: hypothetical protein V1754_05090 [Pseudomonadota bacterium]